MIAIHNKTLISLDGEIWEDIDGWEGAYQISNYLRVKSLERFVYRKGTDILHFIKREQILSPYKSAGYWKVDLYLDDKRGKKFIHILGATAFIPNPFNLPQVNHKDCDKANPDLDNLEWSNQSQNMKHAYKTLGLKSSNYGKFGESSHSSKNYRGTQE